MSQGIYSVGAMLGGMRIFCTYNESAQLELDGMDDRLYVYLPHQWVSNEDTNRLYSLGWFPSEDRGKEVWVCCCSYEPLGQYYEGPLPT